MAEIAFQLENEGEIINLLTCLDALDIYHDKKLLEAINPLILFVANIDRENTVNIMDSLKELDTQSALKFIYEKERNSLKTLSFNDFKHYKDVVNNIALILQEYIPRHHNRIKQTCLFTSRLGVYESLGYPIHVKNLMIESNNKVEEYPLDSDHFNILQSPYINFIADILKKYII